jgi:hypothetical protein
VRDDSCGLQQCCLSVNLLLLLLLLPVLLLLLPLAAQPHGLQLQH